MKLIVAVNNKGWIGQDDQMLWRCMEDLLHFKKMTLGCKCLIGRKTFEALPVLKKRQMLVVGSGYLTLEEALSFKPDWVIGGGSIYEQLVDQCSQIHISYINDDSEGNIAFKIPENYKGNVVEYRFELDMVDPSGMELIELKKLQVYSNKQHKGFEDLFQFMDDNVDIDFIDYRNHPNPKAQDILYTMLGIDKKKLEEEVKWVEENKTKK